MARLFLVLWKKKCTEKNDALLYRSMVITIFIRGHFFLRDFKVIGVLSKRILRYFRLLEFIFDNPLFRIKKMLVYHPDEWLFEWYFETLSGNSRNCNEPYLFVSVAVRKKCHREKDKQFKVSYIFTNKVDYINHNFFRKCTYTWLIHVYKCIYRCWKVMKDS